MIFICSPYAGDTIRNIQNAQQYCRKAVDEGYTPIAPHLFFPQFMDDGVPEERELALQMGLSLLDLCDEMWVFGEPSTGMKKELAYAVAHHIPIQYFSTIKMEKTSTDEVENEAERKNA